MTRKIFAGSFLALLLVGVALPRPKEVSDDEIHDKVRLRLTSDAVVKGGGIDVDVKDGVVTLHGTVELEKQKTRAEKLAKKVSGVKKVNNELKVAPRTAAP